ncbi:MAG: hypothetical protein COB02_12375 [Candidatus Cloacimonadota bacterium]|nr:MAG: hypothetical protein COB02_12375 [Candidatus Cloacimonadota bacterium]
MKMFLVIFFNLFLMCSFAISMGSENLGILQLKQELEAKSLLKAESSKEEVAASQGFEKKIIIIEDVGEFPSITHIKKISPNLLDGFVDKKISYFGHRLFKKLNLELSKFSLETSNVPDDYKIGVGDRFSIHVWNQTQDQIVPVSVNSSGMIKFPLAGEIFVKGIKKEELKSFLLKRLSRFYKTLNLSFEFIKLRQFPIYITGEVRSPGVYMANAISTPLQLIIAAGGPTFEGSLREVELIQGNKSFKKIDFYQYLLTGKFDRNFYLKSGNSIHVPLTKKTIAVLGEVKRVGVFELKSWEKLSHLISYAGGVLSNANTSSFQVVHFNKDGRSVLKDIDFSKSQKVLLADGDVLMVHPRLEEIKNKVLIRGNVYRTGLFEWKNGLTLKKLIKKAQGIKEDTYLERVEIYRLKRDKNTFTEVSGLKVITNKELIIKSLSLDDKEESFYLQAGDEVKVFHLSEVQNSPSVSISGEVVNAKDFPLNWNTKVKDILILAKLTKNAHMKSGEIYREAKNGIKIIKFHIRRALENSIVHNMKLENHDKITIFKDPNRVNQGVIALKGEIAFPGKYTFKMGDTLVSLLKRAGGLTKYSYLPASKFYRKSVAQRQAKMKERFVKREKQNISNMQTQLLSSKVDDKEKQVQIQSLEQVEKTIDKLAGVLTSGRILLSLENNKQRKILKGSINDIALEDGDVFVVPLKPTEVSVSGQVYSPLTELYRKNANLEDYIRDAGGFTEHAYKERVYIIKASGRAIPASVLKNTISSNRYIGKINKKSFFVNKGTLSPGDFIVVPTKIKFRKNRMKDILDSVYKMAITVGALGGLFK